MKTKGFLVSSSILQDLWKFLYWLLTSTNLYIYLKKMLVRMVHNVKILHLWKLEGY